MEAVCSWTLPKVQISAAAAATSRLLNISGSRLRGPTRSSRHISHKKISYCTYEIKRNDAFYVCQSKALDTSHYTLPSTTITSLYFFYILFCPCSLEYRLVKAGFTTWAKAAGRRLTRQRRYFWRTTGRDNKSRVVRERFLSNKLNPLPVELRP